MASTDEVAEFGGAPRNPPLDPGTQDFVETLALIPPSYALSPADARAALVAMQSRPIGRPLADGEPERKWDVSQWID